MSGFTKNPPRDPWRRFNWTVAKLARVSLYLMETREERLEDCKYEPEDITMWAMYKVAFALREKKLSDL